MDPDVALFLPHLPSSPERAANMLVLRGSLAKDRGPAVVREFTEKAPWQERLRSRLTWALGTGAQHIVQLEDDVVTCDVFWPALRAMHTAWPDDLVCLAATHSMAPLVVLQGRRSYRTTKLLGWAFSLTRAQARLALDDLEKTQGGSSPRYVLEDDYLAHLFIERGITPRHPCPTIVDHLHMPSSSSGGDHKTNLQASVTWRGFAAEDLTTPAWWDDPETTLPSEPTRDVRRLPGTCALCDGPGEVLVKATGRDVCRGCLYQAILAESVEHAMHPGKTEQLVYMDWRGPSAQLTVVLGGSESERKTRVADARQAFARVVTMQSALGSPADNLGDPAISPDQGSKKNLVFCVLEGGRRATPFFREPRRSYTLVLVLCHPDLIREHQAGTLHLEADLVLYGLYGEGRKNKFARYAEAVSAGQVRPDFDAVLLPDDDVFPTSTWSDVFSLFHDSALEIAEPALTSDSTCKSVLALQVPGARWRRTSAVEGWAPILRPSALRELLPRMREDNAEGLETYWNTKCAPLGVLDGAPVRRTSPLRVSRDSPAGVQDFCARHGVTPVNSPRTLGHVPEASQITAVTAILGGYEKAKAPPPGVRRAVVVTDGILHSAEDPRWEAVRRPQHGVGPRRLIFMAKLTPHVAVTDDDDVLWLDASMEPTGRDVASLFDLVPRGGLGVFRHSYGPGPGGRTDYWAEAEFSGNDPRYKAGGPAEDRGRLALEQARHYRQRGCPLGGGLWSTGILVWRGAQRRLGERWLAETISWSGSDQIALPWVQHVLGLQVTTLPGNVYDNEWFRYVEHGQVGRTTVDDPAAPRPNGGGGELGRGSGHLSPAARLLLGETFRGTS